MTNDKNPSSSCDQSNESTGMKLEICIACQEAKLGSHWIQCTKDNCESWWHTSCAGLGDCNSKKDIQFCKSCFWVCPLCIVTNNSLLKPAHATKPDENSNLAKEVESVVLKCIPTIVKNCCEKMQNYQCQDIKKSFSEVLKSENHKVHQDQQETLQNLNKKLDCFPSIAKKLNQQQEEDDRLRRKNNLLFFGIPESNHADLEDQLKDDCDIVKLVLRSKIKFCSGDVKAFRLGSKRADKPRPFLIKLENEKIKWEILKASKGLKLFKENQCFPIFVSLDRTVMERNERRKLIAELNERKNKGETNLIIKNNKILEKSAKQPFQYSAQDFWAKIFRAENDTSQSESSSDSEC